MSSPKYAMIFVNLHVNSLATAIPFYKALGFTQNMHFSNSTTAMMALPPFVQGAGTINVMLLERERFKTFLPTGRGVSNAKADTEVLLCLTAESREAVDELVGKAESGGGRSMASTLPDAPQMYGRMFEDPDGHIWEAMWMSEEAVKAGASEKEKK